METKTINIFSFDELSETAQKKACSDYRDAGKVDTQYYWDDAIESVKKFIEIFPIKGDRNSWLEFSLEMDDDCSELTGFRLQKHIWNVYGRHLYKGKYYSLWSKKEKSFKYYKEGYPVLKQRYSRIIKEGRNCVLTGVCYDDDLLYPIYDFLESRNPQGNMQDLMELCFDSLKKSLEDEDEYRESDEAISEDFMGNNFKFFENGKICTL